MSGVNWPIVRLAPHCSKIGSGSTPRGPNRPPGSQRPRLSTFELEPSMQSNFLLGVLKLTEPARLALKRQPYDLIARHAINEHGQISQTERQRNELGMKTLGPIISRYQVDPTMKNSPMVVVLTSKSWNETLIDLA